MRNLQTFHLSIFAVVAGAVALGVVAISNGNAQGDKKKKAKAAPPKSHPTGYTDTPMLPGGKWRVHDDTRPRPEVVTPGRAASGAPSDAMVLFDGSDLDEWVMEKDGSACDWIVKEGFVEVPPKGAGAGG